MRFKITALAIASSALLAASAFGQDNRNHDNQSNHDRGRSSQQQSRPNQSSGRQSFQSPNRGSNQSSQRGSWSHSEPSSRSNNSWSQPSRQQTGATNRWQSPAQQHNWNNPQSSTNRFQNPSQQQHTWNRPQSSSSQFPNQQHNWNRPQTDTTNRWQSPTQQQHSWNSPQSSSNRFQNPTQQHSWNRPETNTNRWQNPTQHNWTAPNQTGNSFQGNRFQGGHAQAQARPTYGNSWNFGRNRDLIQRNYENDSRIYNLRVVNNTFIYQRPEWGGHWREGFLGLGVGSPSWSFGFYLYTPFAAACYVSPWYYYSCLPPYIPAERCVVVPNYSCAWDAGVVYHYRPAVPYDSYGDGLLNQAVENIGDAFTHQDVQGIDALISGGEQVAVFTDGHYDYSLNADDFHDMMFDNIRNVTTIRFDILSVKRDGDFAIVRARHEVRNADGGTDVVYQEYRLRREGNHFVITDFMTTH